MGEAYKRQPTRSARRSGTTGQDRELRAQGQQTMRRLLDAAMDVFTKRGYQATRVDDIVRAAHTSHGTFYLYFANKEDVLGALAAECANELAGLRHLVVRITPDAAGAAALRTFLGRFVATYARYGPVIRAWMEGLLDDRAVNHLGVDAFTQIAAALAEQMTAAGAAADPPAVAALMAMIERFSYYMISRGADPTDPSVLDALTATVHRSFFAAP